MGLGRRTEFAVWGTPYITLGSSHAEKRRFVVRAHFPYIFGTIDMQCICRRTYMYQNSSLSKQSSIIQFHLPSYLEDAELNSCSPAQPI
jgi:hypothetical protein